MSGRVPCCGESDEKALSNWHLGIGQTKINTKTKAKSQKPKADSPSAADSE
jgi:hypothetical protein